VLTDQPTPIASAHQTSQTAWRTNLRVLRGNTQNQAYIKPR
jgi:hypothetical protein